MQLEALVVSCPQSTGFIKNMLLEYTTKLCSHSQSFLECTRNMCFLVLSAVQDDTSLHTWCVGRYNWPTMYLLQSTQRSEVPPPIEGG